MMYLFLYHFIFFPVTEQISKTARELLDMQAVRVYAMFIPGIEEEGKDCALMCFPKFLIMLALNIIDYQHFQSHFHSHKQWKDQNSISFETLQIIIN